MTDQQAPELEIRSAHDIHCEMSEYDTTIHRFPKEQIELLKEIYNKRANGEFAILSSVQAREAFWQKEIEKLFNLVKEQNKWKEQDEARIKELETEIQVMKPLYELYKRSEMK